jgi:hypothetical protein
MTCCMVRLAPGRRHCAYCRRTIRLIRERRCVSCAAPVLDEDTERFEGLCARCRGRFLGRHLTLSAPTRRLLALAARARYRAACTTAYNPRDGVSIPPHETTRLPLTPVVAGSSHPRGVSA